ncbi:MAG: alpha/beta hydrolase fold domain-containing protein [Planctomycetes bacterium]|nr:alpha/beta hydrolase fold domain-containing protein [Planctomycetota bacterium]
MKTARWFRALIVTLAVSAGAFADPPTPPAQPAEGPGGSAASHQKVVSSQHGEGGTAYWLYEPDDPKPATAPVIVFNHGWGATRPGPYGAWIDHLVKRGNIVIYPAYQEGLTTLPAQFTPNAVAAIKEALRQLDTEPGHVKPDLTKFAIVGHSMGGILAANLAAVASTVGLPTPRAIMSIEPGKTWGLPPPMAVVLDDLSAIDAGTLMLAVIGDRDRVVFDVDAKRIIKESTAVPAANKNLVRLVSDDHGKPALDASHLAPVAISSGGESRRPILKRGSNTGGIISVDALDYFGTWKLLDALTDAAFYGTHRNIALGNTPEQRDMGAWSDGTPVKRMEIVTDP